MEGMSYEEKEKLDLSDISFTNVMGSYENKKISRNIGKTTFQLKKTSKSSYGYIITRIEYKGYEVKL